MSYTKAQSNPTDHCFDLHLDLVLEGETASKHLKIDAFHR